MLAPAPPRCCTRSSTRNDSDTFSIWPSTNCSVNFPGKVIRWSMAMEPVTATGTGALPRDGVQRDARWTSDDDPNTLGAGFRARRGAAAGRGPVPAGSSRRHGRAQPAAAGPGRRRSPAPRASRAPAIRGPASSGRTGTGPKRGPPSVGQRPPQRRPQLGDADDTEQAADRRPAGDHRRGPAQAGHHPGPAEGEAGHDDPGGALPDRQLPGLGDAGLPGPGAQVVRQPAQPAERRGQPAGGAGDPERGGERRLAEPVDGRVEDEAAARGPPGRDGQRPVEPVQDGGEPDQHPGEHEPRATGRSRDDGGRRDEQPRGGHRDRRQPGDRSGQRVHAGQPAVHQPAGRRVGPAVPRRPGGEVLLAAQHGVRSTSAVHQARRTGDSGGVLAGLSPARRRLVVTVLALVVVAVLVTGAALLLGRPSGSAGREPVSQAEPGPVLLVPGYGGSTASLRSLADRLTAEGRDATVVTVPGNGTGDLGESAEVLAEAADAALERTGADSVDVVGYSAGGVVARLWAADGGVDVARRVVTLGSPHPRTPP